MKRTLAHPLNYQPPRNHRPTMPIHESDHQPQNQNRRGMALATALRI